MPARVCMLRIVAVLGCIYQHLTLDFCANCEDCCISLVSFWGVYTNLSIAALLSTFSDGHGHCCLVCHFVCHNGQWHLVSMISINCCSSPRWNFHFHQIYQVQRRTSAEASSLGICQILLCGEFRLPLCGLSTQPSTALHWSANVGKIFSCGGLLFQDSEMNFVTAVNSFHHLSGIFRIVIFQSSLTCQHCQKHFWLWPF